MEEWFIELKRESEELELKILELMEYLTYSDIDDDESLILHTQFPAMRIYANVLIMRIKKEEEKIKC